MELTAYIYPGWNPRISTASSRRDWMDDAAESFPYRCLPLKLANEHGWVIGSSCGFSAVWNGGPLPEDVQITLDDDTAPLDAAVALFGQGTVTFHIQALFQTPPGWNLWIGGVPNAAKDGIAPLTGVIETDWSPYSFTMNWRFTRPNHPVRFEPGEPIAFLMPLKRGALEGFSARIAPIAEAPDLKTGFESWSASRDSFQQQVAASPPKLPADKWQKLYFRGLMPDGSDGNADHQAKLRLCPFEGKHHV